ncbi:hypothetical protein HY639_00135 [Candidatus Woesearchaeota archaeon]|nr:hypothetical protein [Candidatus Woesearchaeota archaeon]
MMNWKKECYRDFITLGSPLFFMLAFIRSFLGDFGLWTMRFGGTFVLLLLFEYLSKAPFRFNSHAARATAMWLLISVFYEELIPFFFFGLAGLGTMYSLVQLKRCTWKEAVVGTFLGGVIAMGTILLTGGTSI